MQITLPRRLCSVPPVHSRILYADFSIPDDNDMEAKCRRIGPVAWLSERFDNEMRIGAFADTHDHLDNVRRAVSEFNKAKCDLVVFAGDFVSTFVTPPLRRLNCPFLGCWGDNDGNKRGLRNGVSLIGTIGDPPFGFKTPDGTRVLVTHMLRDLRGYADDCDLVIYAHTHRASIEKDRNGRLLVNPGETSGWSFRKPTIAIIETAPLKARLVALPELGPPPAIAEDNYSHRLSARGASDRTD